MHTHDLHPAHVPRSNDLRPCLLSPIWQGRPHLQKAAGVEVEHAHAPVRSGGQQAPLVVVKAHGCEAGRPVGLCEVALPLPRLQVPQADHAARVPARHLQGSARCAQALFASGSKLKGLARQVCRSHRQIMPLESPLATCRASSSCCRVLA